MTQQFCIWEQFSKPV